MVGKLTVSFHGDAGAGCGRYGLCGYAGAELWWPDRPPPPGTFGYQSPGGLDILTLSHAGHRSVQASLIGASDAPLSATVTRAASSAACRDSAGTGPTELSARIVHGMLTVGLAGAQPWIGTRCAGPLDADLAAALPFGTIPLVAARKGRTTIDLQMMRSFSAHGFAGTVSSTLAIVLGRPQPSGSERPRPPRRRAPTTREVTIS